VKTEVISAGKEVPEVDVIIEIPRGSLLKRGSRERVDFVSPLPCPFNYGAVPTLVGLEGDLLDVVVLGQRLHVGARLRLPAWGVVVQRVRGMVDHKLICSAAPLNETRRGSDAAHRSSPPSDSSVTYYLSEGKRVPIFGRESDGPRSTSSL